MADVFDVIVVGGGIVGCAVVWEMTSYGYKCLLLEKNENLVSEASSGNRFVPYTIGCFCPLLNKNKKREKNDCKRYTTTKQNNRRANLFKIQLKIQRRSFRIWIDFCTYSNDYLDKDKEC